MKRIVSTFAIGVFAFATTFLIGCYPNQRIVNSSTGQWSNTNTNSQGTPVKSTFEQDVESMRTANFVFIYVIRRKDGGPLDADDKRFASQETLDMNRRAVSDEGKAIVVGSNFKLPDENLKTLTERFAFEDLSKPDASETANSADGPKR